MKSQKSIWLATASATFLGLFAGMNAHAEDVAAAGFGMEEIVVSARKRTETVSDIPFSLNVLSDQNLEKMGAQDFTDLLGSVSSLTGVQQGSGRSVIIMRGVSTGAIRNDKPQNQEVVGLYLDDAPIAVNGFNPESVLFDLERIEVLRGPQGTLYGAGSMNGTIRLITKKPDVKAVSAKAEGDVSVTEDGGFNYAVKGMVNVPLVEDRLALRIGASHVENEGYIDNTTTGENNVNDETSSGARVAMRWIATDKLTVDASFLFHTSNDADQPLEQGTPVINDPNGSQSGTRTHGNRTKGGFDDNMKVYNLTLTYDAGFGELVSSTSYMDRSSLSKVSLEYLTENVGASPAAVAATDRYHSLLNDTTNVKDLSQELRLASTGDSDLQWIVGAFFNKRDRYFKQTGVIPGFDAFILPDLGAPPSSFFGAPVDHFFDGYQDITQKQFAAFGEAYYKLKPVTFMIGLRWFDWKQDFTAFSAGLANGGITTIPESGTGVAKADANGVNPKFNVSVDIAEHGLAYAQVAKGYRFGGVNDPVPTVGCENALASLGLTQAPATFKPDTNWNYEAGVKGDFLNKRLNANVTYFYVKWDDIQSIRSLNGLGGDSCPFSYTDNSGKLTSQGVEFDFTVYPVESLMLQFGGSYTSSKLSENAANFDAPKGSRAPFVPKVGLNATAEYNFDVSDETTGFVWVNVQHVGARGTLFNAAAADYRRLDAYQVVNARIGFTWESIEVAAYVKNLFDSHATTFVQTDSILGPGNTFNLRPRTIGLTVRKDF